jgi:hypothetical protein
MAEDEVTDRFSVDVLERWRSPLTMKNDAAQLWINRACRRWPTPT